MHTHRIRTADHQCINISQHAVMHTVPIPIPMPIPISIPYQYHINVECFKTSPHQNIKSSTHNKLTLHRIIKSITTTSLHPAHIVVESNSQSKHHIIPHAAALHQTLKANSTSSASSTLKMSNCHNIRHTASTRQALKASTRHGTQHTALMHPALNQSNHQRNTSAWRQTLKASNRYCIKHRNTHHTAALHPTP